MGGTIFPCPILDTVFQSLEWRGYWIRVVCRRQFLLLFLLFQDRSKEKPSGEASIPLEFSDVTDASYFIPDGGKAGLRNSLESTCPTTPETDRQKDRQTPCQSQG